MELVVIIILIFAAAAVFIFFKQRTDKSVRMYCGFSDEISESDDTDVNGAPRHAVDLTLTAAADESILFRAYVDRSDGSEIIIGRGRECNIVIRYDLSVSARHCRITYFDGLLFIEDLHSANKTILNGRQIIESQRIYPGDRIMLGKSEFIVSFGISDKQGDDTNA